MKKYLQMLLIGGMAMTAAAQTPPATPEKPKPATPETPKPATPDTPKTATPATPETPKATTPAAPVTPAATVQTPPATTAASGDYFPIKSGTTWTYRIDDQRSLEMIVTKSEGGVATIETKSGGRKVAEETIEVKADGIYRTKINTLELKPALCILKLPVKKDDTWDVKTKVSEKEIVGKMTVKSDKEEVSIKGTKYTCVMVDAPGFKVDGSTTNLKMWFAAGKGIVKLSYETGGQEALLELTDVKVPN